MPNEEREPLVKTNLTELEQFVIATIIDKGPSHGLQIIGNVGRASNMEIILSPGTVYNLLSRLCEQKPPLLEEKDIAVDGRMRYYGVTSEGYSALRKDMGIMQSRINIFQSIIDGLGTSNLKSQE
jgi:DNA-binding PadR family transcriptional regulator